MSPCRFVVPSPHPVQRCEGGGLMTVVEQLDLYSQPSVETPEYFVSGRRNAKMRGVAGRCVNSPGRGQTLVRRVQHG